MKPHIEINKYLVLINSFSALLTKLLNILLIIGVVSVITPLKFNLAPRFMEPYPVTKVCCQSTLLRFLHIHPSVSTGQEGFDRTRRYIYDFSKKRQTS